MRTRSSRLLVAVLVLTAATVLGTGVVLADWDVDDQLWTNSCNGVEKDPVNIMFRGNGTISAALSHWDWHMPNWDYVEYDSTLSFKVHGACIDHEDNRMDPIWFNIRDHTRFVNGDYDDIQGDWSAAAAHHDTCVPHAGIDFDETRDKARNGFINGNHYTVLHQTFSPGSVYVNCFGSGWHEEFDGKVAWISIPNTNHT